MKYLRVKPQFDNKILPVRLIYIKNELFTIKEAARWKVNPLYCEEVEISKNKTYYLFGARFQV